MKFCLSADWHIRGDRPTCRRDENWLETQRYAVEFVVNLANVRDLPLLIIGDIFHTPRVSTEALEMLIQELKKADRVYILAGNHDLPFHSWENSKRSSYGILRHYFKELPELCGSPELDGAYFSAAHFGQDEPEDIADLVFTHQLVFPDSDSIPPGARGKTARMIAEEFPNAQWIFTGDYHHAYDVHFLPDRMEGKEATMADWVRVTNPGCLLRQAADMIDYQPKVAIVDTDAETVEWVDVPDPGEMEGGVVTNQYLKDEKVRDAKVGAFIEQIRSHGPVSLSFRDNLMKKLDGKDVPSGVRTATLKIIEKLDKEK